MAQKKQFKDLDLSNAFLFAAALEDEETCRLVLECILGTSIDRVNVKAERSMLFSSDFRCVRLDIFASDGLNVGYNLEMQNADEGNLPQRSRYHQAELVCFLRYVTESTDTYVRQLGNPKLDKIHERIKTLKQSRKLEERYSFTLRIRNRELRYV